MIYLVLKIKSTTVFITGIPELLCWSCGVFSERVGSCCLCLWGLVGNYHQNFRPIETGFVVPSFSTGNIQVRSVAVWCVRMSYLFFYRVFRSHAGYALNSMFIHMPEGIYPFKCLFFYLEPEWIPIRRRPNP